MISRCDLRNSPQTRRGSATAALGAQGCKKMRSKRRTVIGFLPASHSDIGLVLGTSDAKLGINLCQR